jgi:L-lactate dehydrogenase complex protein LldG
MLGGVVSAPGPADDELVRRFAGELTAADGVPHRGREASAVAREVLGSEPAVVAVDDDEGLESVAAALASAGHRVVRPRDDGYRAALPGAAIGVTRCLAAIADTGTLLLACDRSHPRATSLLPRSHLAVVHTGEVVASLADALARIPSPPPSAVTCITGPSRSADIEQILTLGVHGPAHVHVVLP